jgi:Na+(H+)/acetate symporter ActP
MLALFLGTMGLPHVLVRFYTNPDGAAARRTTLVVLMLLSTFYLFPPVFGVLGRLYAPDLVRSGHTDSVVLVLPDRLLPGLGGDLLTALLAAGAFAAFLSTSSGLTVSIAGVIDQDVLRTHRLVRTGPALTALTAGRPAMDHEEPPERPWRRGHQRRGTVPGFRAASVVAVGVPFVLSQTSPSLGLADTVGLAFAVAASTFCPLLTLGVWWSRLTAPGAVSGLVTGGVCTSAAVVATMLHLAGPGWPSALLAQPAAWSVPLAMITTVAVSLATGSRVPRDVRRTMVRLHTPEAVPVDRSVATTARHLAGTVGRRAGRRSAQTPDR